MINIILVKCLLGPRTSSPSLEVHEVTRSTDPSVGHDLVGSHDLVIEEEREEDEEEYSGLTEYPQYTIKEYSENGENYGKGGKGSFQSGPVVSITLSLVHAPGLERRVCARTGSFSEKTWLGKRL